MPFAREMHLLLTVKQGSSLLFKGKEVFCNVLPAGKDVGGALIFSLVLSVVGLLMQLQKQQSF